MNILVVLRELIRENLMECQENIENITNSESNFAPTFANHYVLPHINFDGHCLINNIYIPKKVINIYFLHTNIMVKKFKHRFYIKEFFILICKAN